MLRTKTENVTVAMERAERETGTDTDVLLCADLNRDHSLQGGEEPVQYRERIKEGNKLSTLCTRPDFNLCWRQV
jgi:hypothetical protein